MLPRHSLVWLSQAAWQEAAHALQPAEQALCQHWQQADWPLVVRRQVGAPGQIGLGLAPPPDPASGQKSKLALSCAMDGIVRHQGPLLLRQALERAPLAWQAGLAQLDAQLTAAGMVAEVYGSLAWQALTGQTYVTANSDIDISVPVASKAQLAAAGAALTASSLPLDGELLFPLQQAVAWKEWFLQDAERVLVKQEQAFLCSRQHLLDALA
jgi:phosphoribosyl-dephospho-CoA transferase